MSSIGPEGERSSSEVSYLDSSVLWLCRTIPGQETLKFFITQRVVSSAFLL